MPPTTDTNTTYAIVLLLGYVEGSHAEDHEDSERCPVCRSVHVLRDWARTRGAPLMRKFDWSPIREVLWTITSACVAVGAFFASVFVGAIMYTEVRTLTDVNLAAFFMGILAAVGMVAVHYLQTQRAEQRRGHRW